MPVRARALSGRGSARSFAGGKAEASQGPANLRTFVRSFAPNRAKIRSRGSPFRIAKLPKPADLRNAKGPNANAPNANPRTRKLRPGMCESFHCETSQPQKLPPPGFEHTRRRAEFRRAAKIRIALLRLGKSPSAKLRTCAKGRTRNVRASRAEISHKNPPGFEPRTSGSQVQRS